MRQQQLLKDVYGGGRPGAPPPDPAVSRNLLELKATVAGIHSEVHELRQRPPRAAPSLPGPRSFDDYVNEARGTRSAPSPCGPAMFWAHRATSGHASALPAPFRCPPSQRRWTATRRRACRPARCSIVSHRAVPPWTTTSSAWCPFGPTLTPSASWRRTGSSPPREERRDSTRSSCGSKSEKPSWTSGRRRHRAVARPPPPPRRRPNSGAGAVAAPHRWRLRTSRSPRDFCHAGAHRCQVRRLQSPPCGPVGLRQPTAPTRWFGQQPRRRRPGQHPLGPPVARGARNDRSQRRPHRLRRRRMHRPLQAPRPSPGCWMCSSSSR